MKISELIDKLKRIEEIEKKLGQRCSDETYQLLHEELELILDLEIGEII